ncbi:benzoate membrane transport protein [Formivibrio citricus]|uniref:Benzoate membrane transport protein n=1 Tax=Formivibrio citricus TaxID=83765 RepID=A0A1I4V8C8_9NEIS|nr:benzoate/H(+) symporter BenE family transporter [Formivibrio citricus]SFM97411.1 benzoate membrane transport protein [Formivibrio citricus]
MPPTRNISLSALTAGFVTVLVGYTSSAAIIFEAARAAGGSQAQIASWLIVLGVAMGLTCIGLSLRYRVPVVTAWSTPGAALLATSLSGYSMNVAVGCFLLSALLILLSGLTGWFERVMNRVPMSLCAALLAGVLVRFGMNAFTSMQTALALVLPMFLTYLACKRYKPRYAMLIVLLLGLGLAHWQGLLHLGNASLQLAAPVWIAPEFSMPALIGVGLPLFIVTMASQNIPGVAVLRSAGYTPPLSPIIGWTGLVNLLLAPFGCFAVNLAAITAAICMGKDAHEDPAKRYHASIVAGVFYLLLGILGAAVGGLLAVFPRELIFAIAGFALLGTIGNGLTMALREENQREPALITFVVTASGLTLFGIGPAFWGLVAGVAALFALGGNSHKTAK